MWWRYRIEGNRNEVDKIQDKYSYWVSGGENSGMYNKNEVTKE